MEPKLTELLTSINTRFSGPQSCRLSDMITGRLDFDSDEIRDYLNGLAEFGGLYGNKDKKKDYSDAKFYLDKFNDYIKTRDKNRV